MPMHRLHMIALFAVASIALACEDPGGPIGTGPLPDLVATSLTASDTALVGGPIAVEFSVENASDTVAEASGIVHRLLLSTDAVVDDADIVLGQVSGRPLEAGGAYDDADQFTVGDGVADGEYFILLVLDADDAVEEVDEANNARATAAAVPILLRPDLQIASCEAGVFQSGSQYHHTFSHSVENIGNDAIDSSYTVGYYLSTDSLLDATVDSLLAFASFSAVGAMEPDTVRVDTMAIDSGRYHLIFSADHAGAIDELREDNNVRYCDDFQYDF